MKRLLWTVAFAVVVAGCSGTKLDDAKTAEVSSDAHGQKLYQGYLALAESEYAQGDYKDSDHFAELAQRAAAGEKFEPQQISARDLPAENLNAAATARRKLIVALYNGAAQKFPNEAAASQVNFDCWVEQLEENFQTDDIAVCRAAFQAAIGRLGTKMTDRVVMSTVAPDEPLIFEVFFDFDSDELSNPVEVNLSIISRIIAGFESPLVAVFGNADQSGASEYNFDLAGRRAENVKQTLEKNGVTVSATYNQGDTVPKIETLNLAPLRANRRVTILVSEKET